MDSLLVQDILVIVLEYLATTVEHRNASFSSICSTDLVNCMAVNSLWFELAGKVLHSHRVYDLEAFYHLVSLVNTKRQRKYSYANWVTKVLLDIPPKLENQTEPARRLDLMDLEFPNVYQLHLDDMVTEIYAKRKLILDTLISPRLTVLEFGGGEYRKDIQLDRYREIRMAYIEALNVATTKGCKPEKFLTFFSKYERDEFMNNLTKFLTCTRDSIKDISLLAVDEVTVPVILPLVAALNQLVRAHFHFKYLANEERFIKTLGKIQLSPSSFQSLQAVTIFVPNGLDMVNLIARKCNSLELATPNLVFSCDAYAKLSNCLDRLTSLEWVISKWYNWKDFGVFGTGYFSGLKYLLITTVIDEDDLPSTLDGKVMSNIAANCPGLEIFKFVLPGEIWDVEGLDEVVITILGNCRNLEILDISDYMYQKQNINMDIAGLSSKRPLAVNLRALNPFPTELYSEAYSSAFRFHFPSLSRLLDRAR